MEPLLETNLPNLFHRGKVRDTYDLGDQLLIVATDRISAFDVVLPNGIPDKGKVLTQLSAFWFQKTAHIVPNHLIELVDDVRLLNSYVPKETCYLYPQYIVGRSMIVRKAQRIDIECVVRGYLSGSAWEEYQRSGSICGIRLPAGLRESEQLPEPIFTPTTKAEPPAHDEPLTFEQVVASVGEKVAHTIRDRILAVYKEAADYARHRGIIIADTKLEFGLVGGQVILIDELLTPDSSRFWDAESYQPGRSQPSFDKQPVRDWLVASGWDKQPPAPSLPPEVVQKTSERYREAFRRLTGRELA
jgi:phosphoribosylaminoimidazole-succinocarboxamide synthase